MRALATSKFLLAITTVFSYPTVAQPTHVEVPDDVLADRIQGGLLGQILGNLNGLPHELKYNDAPGNVETYTPSLPEGARTDDDTDIEWVYITEMDRMEQLRNELLPGTRQDLTGTPQTLARAAYLAIALGESEALAKHRPEDWQQAIAALKGHPKLIEALFKAPSANAKPLQDRARAAGLEPAPRTRPQGNK